MLVCASLFEVEQRGRERVRARERWGSAAEVQECQSASTNSIKTSPYSEKKSKNRTLLAEVENGCVISLYIFSLNLFSSQSHPGIEVFVVWL